MSSESPPTAEQEQELAVRFEALRREAGKVFTPSAPIDQRNLFAGRLDQFDRIIDAVQSKGQHGIVYGERGVGKTSLVRVIAAVLATERIATVVNCNNGDTFSSMWKRAFSGIQLTNTKHLAGFDRKAVTQATSIATQMPADSTPDDAVKLLRAMQGSLFVFDEFDTISDKNVTRLFANTIKMLSDYAVDATVILVGVGDNVGDLLESHASVERALKQILMPRMNRDELLEIINKATTTIGVQFDDDAAGRIVKLSQGLPQHVHSLGLMSARRAFRSRRMNVTTEDVDAGIADTVSNADRSLLDAYHSAVGTPQKKTLFKEVLLACALTHPDERGYFAPVDVKTSLKKIGKPLEITTFASHLNTFASPERGSVLQKTGSPRRFKYRFNNPLMQPYVAMKGVSDGMLTSSLVDEVLGAHPSHR